MSVLMYFKLEKHIYIQSLDGETTGHDVTDFGLLDHFREKMPVFGLDRRLSVNVSFYRW